MAIGQQYNWLFEGHFLNKPTTVANVDTDHHLACNGRSGPCSLIYAPFYPSKFTNNLTIHKSAVPRGIVVIVCHHHTSWWCNPVSQSDLSLQNRCSMIIWIRLWLGPFMSQLAPCTSQPCCIKCNWVTIADRLDDWGYCITALICACPLCQYVTHILTYWHFLQSFPIPYSSTVHPPPRP